MPEKSLDQVRLCARKSEDENFQQIVSENYKIENFIFLLDLMNSLFDEVPTKKPILLSNEKKLQLFTLYRIFFFLTQDGSGISESKQLLYQVKIKKGLCRVLLTKAGNSCDKLKLILVEMRHSPDVGKMDAKTKSLV